MPKPIWNGFITFGLVNIPVILFPAEKRKDIQFKLIDNRDKSRIHYVRINESTGKEVPWENVAKGYEYGDDEYLIIKDEDIKNFAGKQTKTIEIDAFINLKELDYMDFEKPYYIVPDKKGEKGYVILREILNATNKAGIAKVMIHTRQYLAALMTHGDALVLNLLRYPEEIRKPSEFELPSSNAKAHKITAKEIDVAKQLVASMTTKWKPSDYHDEFKAALEKWIDENVEYAKHGGGKKKHLTKVVMPKANVINFVDLLKKSLKEEKNKHKSSSSKSKKKSHAK